jgi:hypothetical protein
LHLGQFMLVGKQGGKTAGTMSAPTKPTIERFEASSALVLSEIRVLRKEFEEFRAEWRQKEQVGMPCFGQCALPTHALSLCLPQPSVAAKLTDSRYRGQHVPSLLHVPAPSVARWVLLTLRCLPCSLLLHS